ncbi:hypothetical protein O6H91_06G092400 [Diphasiastrum complanatum]|nr:hypothetical protein O6H91_08G002500 [Diphasiastrum complanatum]KAJ7553312.1 hypothetical protein O6H91_06G092400 [Diphasiastrum complanatum]
MAMSIVSSSLSSALAAAFANASSSSYSSCCAAAASHVHSNSSSFFFGGSRGLQVSRGKARLTCLKKDIHPEFHSKATVYCNGELVMTTGGTQPNYVVDVWSGNHPFFQGNKSALVLDADRVDKFKKRYGNIAKMSEIPVLTRGEIIIEKKKKGPKKGGKK